jgi:hypothetical protein
MILDSKLKLLLFIVSHEMTFYFFFESHSRKLIHMDFC